MATSTETIVLGGGCFWCLEASFLQIAGILESVSGYAGGNVPNPSYEAVATGTTGHAEVVQLTFDTAVLQLKDVLDIFWAIHNPTTLNRQGADVGTDYRSIILYANETQKTVAEQSIQEVQALWPDPIVTELKPLTAFYPAEEFHQHFFEKYPASAYCQIVINPKLAKLRAKFTARLKNP